jgi:peptidoglycan hydrolase-like protein with peptidoglycan-binding domain
MKKLLLSFGLSLTILGVNSLPILAQSTNSYTRCRNNPNEYCLRRGDRGQLINELISNLTCLNYYSGVNDGIFGSGTETGVRNFQRDHGLTIDGIAGPQTRNLLNQQCT